MEINPDSAKAASGLLVPFVSALVETWVKPALGKLKDKRDEGLSLAEQGSPDRILDYLVRTYDANSFLSTIVLQGRPKPLKDIYLPLTLEGDGRRRHVIDGYPKELLDAIPRILLIDAAGMGKSTILKRMFLGAVEANEGLPVYLSLRSLSRRRLFSTAIQEILSPVDELVSLEFVKDLLAQGGFTFFLDGYDEVPFSERPAVLGDLERTIERAGKNRYVVASRPEWALASLSRFTRFGIRSLERDEAFALLKRYDESGPVSEKLVSVLKGQHQNSDVGSFLGNPLLTTLLFRAFQYKGIVPLQRHVFFRQVYDALYETHDLTKGEAFVREKASGLDVEEFHRVVRRLAYDTAKKAAVEYDRDQLAFHVETARRSLGGLRCTASDIIGDLLVAVPLLQEDGPMVRWCHKAMQDYFAAQFICLDAHELRDRILGRLASDDTASQFENLLTLCFAVDSEAFSAAVVEPLSREFLTYLDEVASMCEPAQRHLAVKIAQLTFDSPVMFMRAGDKRWRLLNQIRSERGRAPIERNHSKRISGGNLVAYIEPPVNPYRRTTLMARLDLRIAIPATMIRGEWADDVSLDDASTLEAWFDRLAEPAWFLGPGQKVVLPQGEALSVVARVLATLHQMAERPFCLDEHGCRRVVERARTVRAERDHLLEGL